MSRSVQISRPCLDIGRALNSIGFVVGVWDAGRVLSEQPTLEPALWKAHG